MNDEGQYDNGPKAPANPKGFEPLDLSQIRQGLPPQKEKSPVDLQFDAAYASVQSAVERGDAERYVKELGQLAQVMRTEVIQNNAPPNFGDLPHTFMEWQHQNSFLYEFEADKIKKGVDVSKPSNTLDNHGKPHRDWPGDTTMSRNSQSFGGAVADYVNKRGRDFITGSVVPGQTEQHSHYQVLTTFKGLPKTSTAK